MDNTEIQTTLITRKQKGESGMDNTDTNNIDHKKTEGAIRNG